MQWLGKALQQCKWSMGHGKKLSVGVFSVAVKARSFKLCVIVLTCHHNKLYHCDLSRSHVCVRGQNKSCIFLVSSYLSSNLACSLQTLWAYSMYTVLSVTGACQARDQHAYGRSTNLAVAFSDSTVVNLLTVCIMANSLLLCSFILVFITVT